jgi:hypothetical protein
MKLGVHNRTEAALHVGPARRGAGPERRAGDLA